MQSQTGGLLDLLFRCCVPAAGEAPPHFLVKKSFRISRGNPLHPKRSGYFLIEQVGRSVSHGEQARLVIAGIVGCTTQAIRAAETELLLETKSRIAQKIQRGPKIRPVEHQAITSCILRADPVIVLHLGKQYRRSCSMEKQKEHSETADIARHIFLHCYSLIPAYRLNQDAGACLGCRATFRVLI